ncbi:MAG: lytic transglycosylase domain-containing protein [Campylobacterales bacterium]|nr:lytic transglycosylase domain-containing protein [Campylobacterales bacterium]
MIKNLLIFFVLSLIHLHANTGSLWNKAGEAFGIDPRLLYAIASVESNHRPLSVSANYKKMSSYQKQRLLAMLSAKGIPHITMTKVISIENRNLAEALEVITFLDYHRYPSFDIGLMQVNNIHKERLQKEGITLHQLLMPATNLKVAAEILADCYKRHRNNRKAINAYNGKLYGNPYYSKVENELKKLLFPHEKSNKRLFYQIL